MRRRLGHFIIIGGGFSGVETAGELVDCLRSIRRYYPRVGSDDLKVTLLHDLPRLRSRVFERFELRLRIAVGNNVEPIAISPILGCVLTISTF